MARPLLVMGALGAWGAASACAASGPNPELVDARTAYANAKVGLAATRDPAGLEKAQRALESAEQEQRHAPGSQASRDLAYLAQREAMIAETRARLALAEADDARARGTLAEARSRLAKEPQGPEDVTPGRRAKTLERLAPFADVRESPGGLVINLSDSALFAAGAAELVDAGRDRLARVVDSIGDPRSRVVTVIDHAWSSGLARRRAEAVRDHLVSRGLERGLVKVAGEGGDADPHLEIVITSPSR